jgi:cyanobactin cluster PatC/TenC/TruC protein
MANEKKETVAKEKTEVTPSEVSSPPKEKKSYVPTSQTGLQDYAFWCEYAEKHSQQSKKHPKKQTKSTSLLNRATTPSAGNSTAKSCLC